MRNINKYLFLMMLVLSMFSLVSATTFGYNKLDTKISTGSGNITNYYNVTQINMTTNVTNNIPNNITEQIYITNNITNNFTINATVNETQFISNSPITINLTWLSNLLQYKITWAEVVNGTVAMVSDLVNYNSTGLIIDWNSTGFIRNQTPDLSAYYLKTNPFSFYNSTTAPIYLNDTFRGTNYSTFLTHITWANAINGTLYLSSNPSNFITNGTMNKSVSCSNIIGGSDVDYCADATGAGGATRAVYVTNATQTNATGLTWETLFNITLVANTNYTVDCNLIHSSNATTSGIRYNMTLAGVPDYMRISLEASTSATAKLTRVVFGASLSLMPAAVTASLADPAYIPDQINIFIDGNENTGGTAKLLFSGELAALIAIVGRGSYCEVEAI